MDAGSCVSLAEVKKVKDQNEEHHSNDQTLFDWRHCVLPLSATMNGEIDEYSIP